MEISYEPVDHIVAGEAAPKLAIPDMNSQGVSSAITIAETGAAKDVSAGVEIGHTYIISQPLRRR